MTRTEQGGPFPQSVTEGDLINLALGQPSPDLLPLELVHRAANRGLGSGTDPLLLQYGSAMGAAPQRQALAAFLSRRHGIAIDWRSLLFGASTSAHLALVARTLIGLTGRTTILAGDPTYFLARKIFESVGGEVEGIAVDRNGIDVDAIEARLQEGPAPAFIYVLPTYHNPCGVTLDAKRRAKLIALAQTHETFVVADEPYNLLDFHGPRLAPLQSLDDNLGRVISLGTFSKLLGPGMRSGWIQASPSLLDRVVAHGVFLSGGGLNPIVAQMIAQVLESGELDQHIDHLRVTYRERAQRLMQALAAHLPLARPLFDDPKGPAGGYFAWIDMSAYLGERSATELRSLARASGVDFTPGERCRADTRVADAHRHHVRFSWSFYRADELELAVIRLAQVLKR
jgi:DNA-binding transcriptional MocR family regulator